MTFDAGTWWLALLLLGALTGTAGYLIKRAVFGRVDKMEKTVEALREESVKKPDHDKSMAAVQEDIKQIRQDYTPRADHRKDLDECRADIKKIKEDYITKEDFFREQAKTDRKLDRIMDILLEMKGDKKGE